MVGDALSLSLSIACLSPMDRQQDERIQPVYDETTGRLQLLKYDSQVGRSSPPLLR